MHRQIIIMGGTATPIDWKILPQLPWRVLNTEEGLTSVDYQASRRDGSIRWYSRALPHLVEDDNQATLYIPPAHDAVLKEFYYNTPAV